MDYLVEGDFMLTLVELFLSVAVIGQVQASEARGQVVDENGKPVAGVPVVFTDPFAFKPVVLPTQTDGEGRFRIIDLPTGPGGVWTYRPGSVIANAGRISQRAIVLRSPQPRTMKIEDSQGRPIAGARISPRGITFLSHTGFPDAWVPESFAESMTVTTDSDGRATIGYLNAGDRLLAVRLSADSIGTQDIAIVSADGGDPAARSMTIRLKPTSRIVGRVVDGRGHPIIDQQVEIWFKLITPHSTFAVAVGFKNGPPRTAADGSFRTPDTLFVGTPYRVVVRGPGLEPVISDWTTITEAPIHLPPMVVRPLRTIAGRVVDQQGQPVAGIEVFQSGDGPERTAVTTGADGRFSLGGFRQGTVFLFARGEHFRFHGQLVKADESEFTIKLTRLTERPVRRMRMLSELFPLEESRALARRLVNPYWKVAIEKDSDYGKRVALRSLATADPAGIVEKLATVKFRSDRANPIFLLKNVVPLLALTEPQDAAAVAESIADPDLRVAALLEVIDALPDDQRDRKKELIDRAALPAKNVTDPSMRLRCMGDVAEHWFELGEIEKARSLFAEGVRLANQFADKGNFRRGLFAARLAYVNLPEALAIARDMPERATDGRHDVLANIALRLARVNPSESERVLNEIPKVKGRYRLPPRIVRDMAATDPDRARRLVEQSKAYQDDPTLYLFLALGLKSRDPRGAEEAAEVAIRGIDRLMREGPEYSAFGGTRGVILPFYEEIDPALVPEVFWRAVATRPPIGNPRLLREYLSGELVKLLACYDREVAEALFERVKSDLDHASDRELAADRAGDFLGWALIDPRAAVARLEKVRISPGPDLNADLSRTTLAEFLGLPHEQRWRSIWSRTPDFRHLFLRDIR